MLLCLKIVGLEKIARLIVKVEWYSNRNIARTSYGMAWFHTHSALCMHCCWVLGSCVYCMNFQCLIKLKTHPYISRTTVKNKRNVCKQKNFNADNQSDFTQLKNLRYLYNIIITAIQMSYRTIPWWSIRAT